MPSDRTELPNRRDAKVAEQALASKDGPWILPSEKAIIRRYMKFTTLRKFVGNGTARFSQASSFDDDFEGTLTKPVKNNYKGGLNSLGGSLNLPDSGDVKFGEAMENFHGARKHQYYVNCWRLGRSETRDIWEGYADLEYGVAVQSTVGDYINSIDSYRDMSMGKVQYVEQSDNIQTIPPALYFYKRYWHSDENEFRAVFFDGSKGIPIIQLDGESYDKEERPDYPEWHPIKMDLGRLINKILLSPEADGNLRAAVDSVLHSNNISVPIENSILEN
jgi:hypothetical protein